MSNSDNEEIGVHMIDNPKIFETISTKRTTTACLTEM